MSSELLASGVDNLKGHLAGAFNVLTGSSGDYTDLGIGRKFGGAAAAYSLRDIGAMNGPVVRVRRDSDNSEQDFSALAVPFIPDWCNRQVVKPLDVQALQSDGRTGDFVIAKAAYSLRSLGDRQATVAATGDTVARANGKYVVQVRRSSDDTIKSFTADEVTDGTLVAFVGSGNDGFVRTWYDQSVSDQAGSTANAHHAIQATAANQPKVVSSGSLVANNGIDFDDASEHSLVATSVSGMEAKLSVFATSVRDSTGYTVSLSNSSNSSKYFAIQEGGSNSTLNTRNTTSVTASPSVSGNTRLTFGLTTGDTVTSAGALGGALTTDTTDYGDAFGSGDLDQIVIGTLRTVSPSATHFFEGRIQEILVYASSATGDQTDNRGAFEANIALHFAISGIPAEDSEVNGFVETWYDQSGNGNDAVQATAGSQPIIVSSGVLEDGIKFAASNDGSSPDILQVATRLGTTTDHFVTTVISKYQTAATAFGGIISTRKSSAGFAYGISGSSKVQSFFYASSGNANSSATAALANNCPRTLVSFDKDGDTLTGFTNGATNGISISQGFNTPSTTLTNIGVAGSVDSPSSTGLQCNIDELIVYETDQATNQSNIESNIANHYGITLS